MWFKRHERILKIAIISAALVVAVVVIKVEADAQREFFAAAEIEEQEFQKKKPFYDCLLAAAAMANENSPEPEQRAAVEAGDECYARYR